MAQAKKTDSDNTTNNRNRLSAGQVAAVALAHITDLTGKDVVGATSVQPAEDGWTVEVEVVEESRIPSSADILALFETELDAEGELRSYRRLRRYARGKSDEGGS